MDEINRSKFLNDIEYFSRKLEEDPASKLFMPLSVALLKLNKYDDVIYYCGHGLEHFPENIAAKTVMAQAYMGKGRVEDAKGLLTQVILISHDNYKANKLMGDIFRAEDDFERTLEYYQKAFKISPENKRLGEEIKELELLVEHGEPEIEELELPDSEEDLVESMAAELADEMKEEFSVEPISVEELEEDEIEQVINEIHEKESHDIDIDELDKFDIESFGREDFEIEIKENLFASVEEAINSKAIERDVVRLDEDEEHDNKKHEDLKGVEAEEPEAEPQEMETEDSSDLSFDDEEPIELDDFAAEIAKAEDEAVMSLIANALAPAYSDDKNELSDEDELSLYEEEQEPTELDDTESKEESTEKTNELPAPEDVEADENKDIEQNVEVANDEAIDSGLEVTDEEQTPEPETIGYTTDETKDDTILAPVEEETSFAEKSVEAVKSSEEEKQLSPQERLQQAKQLLVQAQVETLENVLICINRKKQKRRSKDNK